MSYRDDLSAAAARSARLESALAEARAENERLRRELAARSAVDVAAPPRSAEMSETQPCADRGGQRFGWSHPMTYVPMIIIALERIREDWALADSRRMKVLLAFTSPIVVAMSTAMNIVFFPFLVLWGHHVRWR